MPVRLRKFIGLIVTLLWVILYALILTRLAIDILPGAHWAVTLAFYAIGGLAWIAPLLPLIRWMQRPDPPR